MRWSVVVLNETTETSDEEIGAWSAAIQIQVTRDLAPAWGVDATLTALPKGSTPPEGQALIVYRDSSDQPGAAGYHELLKVPVGYVFMNTGLIPSTIASHETGELLVDPWICSGAQLPDETWAALEPFDMAEDDAFGYEINGVRVSDFCLPSYFDGVQASTYDFTGNLTRPAPALLDGGYISLWTGGRWVQLNADRAKQHRPVPGWSRRWRRCNRNGTLKFRLART